MKNYYTEPNGYLETIQKAYSAIRTFDLRISGGVGTREEQIVRLKKEIETADAVLVGAGAGLSASAGLTTAANASGGISSTLRSSTK